MTHPALHIYVFLFALAGFLLAYYIRAKKRSPEPLVCPLGAECDSVVRGEYASFLGIPVELLGMGYYAAVLIGQLAFLLFPALMTVESMFVLLALTTLALLFSLYLTALQALVLHAWCTWCLSSGAISVLIFFTSLAASRFRFTELLAENAYLLTLIQALALAVGVGGTTIATLFYTKFLADLRVSTGESDVLRAIVQVIWIALAAVLLTGVGLYLPRGLALVSYTPPVIAALVVTVLLSVISFVLYYLVAPKLATISQGDEHEHAPGETRRFRRAIFALCALSLVSWYFVFVLRMLAPRGVSAGTLLLTFVGVLGASVFLSLVYEKLQPR
jgi:uncharacterized membrane protein